MCVDDLDAELIAAKNFVQALTAENGTNDLDSSSDNDAGEMEGDSELHSEIKNAGEVFPHPSVHGASSFLTYYGAKE